MAQEEFDRIVESVPELGVLGSSAPDGFIVLVGVDGSRVSLPRIDFMELTNAACDGLKDPDASLGEVLALVGMLEPLARRVVLETAWQYFKDWLLDSCPTDSLSRTAAHATVFVPIYRELVKGSPGYSGEFFYEGAGG